MAYMDISAFVSWICHLNAYPFTTFHYLAHSIKK